MSDRDRTERLALTLRAYAYSRGASWREDDEQAALIAAAGLIARLGLSVGEPA